MKRKTNADKTEEKKLPTHNGLRQEEKRSKKARVSPEKKRNGHSRIVRE